MEQRQEYVVPPEWAQGLTEREVRQVLACMHYARDFPDAGLPGHSLMILVAKLTKKNVELCGYKDEDDDTLPGMDE